MENSNSSSGEKKCRDEKIMSTIEQKEFQLKSEEKIIVRNAVPEDAEGLLAFGNGVLTDATEFFVTEPDEALPSIEDEKKFIQENLDGEGKLAIVAEARYALVGFLNFNNNKRRRQKHGGAFGMSVGKEWRGKGVGSALLQTLLAWAKENSAIEKVCLGVFPENERGLALYKKFGFVEEGRRVREVKMPDGKYVDTILMYRFVK